MNTTRVILICFAMAALTQAGLVLYTPAFLEIAKQFHVSASSVEVTLTVYLLGFGASQLFYGVLSERYGRRKLVLVGMIIFSIGCSWSIFADTYFTFLLSRIIQGIGAGSCMVLSRTIFRDCFKGADYVRSITYLTSGFAFGLGVTPVIGGHLLQFFSWRAGFVFLFICGLALLVSIYFFLPETREITVSKLPLKKFYNQTAKNILFILKTKNFFLCLFGGVSAYSIIIAYNTVTPFLFQKTLGYSSSTYGWLTFIIAVVYYLSTTVNRILIKRFEIHHILKTGIALMFIAGFSMLLPKVFFNSMNLLVIFIPMMVATFAQALVWSISVAYSLKGLSHISGTAAALFSCFQILLSALISGLIAIPSESTQTPLAIMIITLAVIAWISFQRINLEN